jgi:cysteinyl-tRNA synthetase
MVGSSYRPNATVAGVVGATFRIVSLVLHDTARGQVVPFEPREPGRVTMYVCGPTVYGPPHLGHGRFTLVFDVLRRYLEWSGNDVTYISNITDIDDQIIARAEREGRRPEDVAEECEALWYTAMDAIGVRRPDDDPHATGWVDGMVELVSELIDAGKAYETDDGVYLAVDQVEGYGLLARQTLDSLRSGARIAVDEQKRSPLDFVLWKKAKPGEPTWDSPWGPGRPGWHTECVVMSLGLLGEGFDIHGGGQDLAFPHHENERAQALALGRTFARHWVHNGFVEVDGEKMSKSLGNFTNLQDLIDSGDPRAYRLLVLRAHYRSPVEISRATTEDASVALGRLDSLARRMGDVPVVDPSQDDLATFRARMDDDLDTPGAVDLLFRLIRRANTALDGGDPRAAAEDWATISELCGALGLAPRTDEDEVPEEVLALARSRDEARAARDFAEADRLRDEIAAAGFAVEDTPDGTRVTIA